MMKNKRKSIVNINAYITLEQKITEHGCESIYTYTDKLKNMFETDEFHALSPEEKRKLFRIEDDDEK